MANTVLSKRSYPCVRCIVQFRSQSSMSHVFPLKCLEPPRITTNHQHQRTTADHTTRLLTYHSIAATAQRRAKWTGRIESAFLLCRPRCPSSFRSPSSSACPVLRAELTSLFVDLQDVAELVSEFKHCGPNTSGWDWRSSQSGDKCCNLSFDHQSPSGSLQWGIPTPHHLSWISSCAKGQSGK